MFKLFPEEKPREDEGRPMFEPQGNDYHPFGVYQF